MELGHFSTISNTTLLSLSVLGDAVPPTHKLSGMVAEVTNERANCDKLGKYYKFKQYEQLEMKSKGILFRKPLLKAQNNKIC